MTAQKTQYIRSAPARVPVMVKKGKKLIVSTYITKSGQVKNKYMENPGSHIIKSVKHIRPHG
jgi:hypothetical protein